MSSDDSGFDKEAEREKLREKYEQDRADRENTRRMSELLLQGATMTGKHCDECGDPIFRYDGREFCPTCQHEADAQRAGARQQNGGDADQSGQPADQSGRTAEDATRAGADADDVEGSEPGDDAAADEPAAESTEPADGARRTDRSGDADDEPRVEIEGVRVADRHVDRSNVRRPPSRADSDRGADPTRGRRESARDHDHGHGHARGRERGPASSGADDLATAREALVRKLSDLARQAEATDDVARARDLLAATREAAEALAALDRADR